MQELFDPNVQWHGGDPTAEGACRTRDEALQFIRRARDAGQIGELVDLLDMGDQVVAVMRPPTPPGAPSTLRANLTTFRDGRVVEMIAFESPEAAIAAATGSAS